MRNLLRFLYKYYFFLFFLILEVIAVSMGIQYSLYQRARFVSATENISAFFNETISSFSDYFQLVETNRKLSLENTRLKNQLQRVYRSDDLFFIGEQDTLHRQKYFFTSARVINNSVNRMHNYLTIDKGRKQGISPEMGVICPEGIVGITAGVTKNFSSVISLLNINFHVSAKLKKNDYFGTLSWDGQDYRRAILNDIPYHVSIELGDTVVTSGFSAIFPEGIMIGTVEKAKVVNGNFYTIVVKLSTDFKCLVYVDVISNLQKKERKKLENYD
ncbi:MAG TPA: rod shape-determining protein MreC [Bacteroidetes bacterium]|nr:rod shape-determining protein MreC [Bacteroidota bacterium]